MYRITIPAADVETLRGISQRDAEVFAEAEASSSLLADAVLNRGCAEQAHGVLATLADTPAGQDCAIRVRRPVAFIGALAAALENALGELGWAPLAQTPGKPSPEKRREVASIMRLLDTFSEAVA